MAYIQHQADMVDHMYASAGAASAAGVAYSERPCCSVPSAVPVKADAGAAEQVMMAMGLWKLR
jgi:hypothetical protein